MTIFSSRRESTGGASTVARGEALGEIEALTAANRERPDAETERRLLVLRHQAFAELDRADEPPPLPQADASDLEQVEGLPAVALENLTPAAIRAGMERAGCLLVRGLVSEQRAAELAAQIEQVLDARESQRSGQGGRRGSRWYEPLRLGGGAFNLERQRQWVDTASGVWVADSPRVAFELFEFFDSSGLSEVIAGYLGERPAVSVNKWTLRCVSPGSDADWHQDGAFLGEDIRALNVWLSLSHCGRDAPGMDVVAEPTDRILETGTEGARFPWSVSPAKVDEAIEGDGPERPAFRPGDVLLFDQYLLHRTANEPSMTNNRYAVETWCFAPSAYPEKQVPLVL